MNLWFALRERILNSLHNDIYVLLFTSKVRSNHKKKVIFSLILISKETVVLINFIFWIQTPYMYTFHYCKFQVGTTITKYQIFMWSNLTCNIEIFVDHNFPSSYLYKFCTSS